MASDPALKARQTSYQDTVINYISKEGGHVIALTDDQAFSTQLRLTLAKELGLSAPGQFTALTDPRHLPGELRNLLQRHPAPLLFLERSIGGQDLSFLVGQIKQAYTALKIIILTSEVQRDRLMLLHEVGADNFIAKPVSMNTLIEKMAFTIKPQGKLGQAIDLAKGLLERKEYTQALAASRKILEIKPGSAAAYLVMGDAHRGLAEYDLAREAYEAAAAAADLYLAPFSGWQKCTNTWATGKTSCATCKSSTTFHRSTSTAKSAWVKCIWPWAIRSRRKTFLTGRLCR